MRKQAIEDPSQTRRYRELKELYASYNDQKLLTLCEEELTEIAQMVLEKELESRGLSLAGRQAIQEEAPEHTEQTWVIIWTADCIEECVAVVEILKTAQFTPAMAPHRSVSRQNFAVSVPSDQAEAALGRIVPDLVESERKQIYDLFSSSQFSFPPCPGCRSLRVTFEGVGEGNQWFCESCKLRWEELANHGNQVASQAEAERSHEDESDRAVRKTVSLKSVIAIVLQLCISALLVSTTWPEKWTLQYYCGLVLWCVGGATWAIARWQLGYNFAVKAAARELVTTGVYARLQNPIYISGVVMLAGIVIWLNRPWWLLLVFVVVPIQIMRIRNERSVLTAAFGERYLQYRARTWF